ncbi:MAG: hypothetical protein JXQ87_05045 [Bacteroidia bacterium]
MRNFGAIIWLFILLFFQSCVRDDQTRFKNRMEGTWQMNEVIIHINPDGTSTQISETPIFGTLILQNDPNAIDVGIWLEYSITLNNSNFRWELLPFKTDEDNKRVFFYNFFCNELFGCDLVATIEKNERNLQQWSWIRPEANGVHKKVTWTLTKD